MDLGRYGVREVANVTFRPLQPTDIAGQHFDKYQPCLFMDTATVSSFEGTATTVYARGGQGNPKLIAWDGEKELTVTFTDALLSTISLAMLSGAEVSSTKTGQTSLVHCQYDGFIKVVGEGEGATANVVVKKEKLGGTNVYCYGPNTANQTGLVITSTDAPRAYAYLLDDVGAVEHVFTGYISAKAAEDGKSVEFDLSSACRNSDKSIASLNGEPVRIDYYAQKSVGITELNITPDTFAGAYYIEAEALFRDEETSMDFPATFIIPRGKLQSNFTLQLQNSGDPSTFDFKIDAMPGIVRGGATKGEEVKRVLMAIQVQEPGTGAAHPWEDNSIHGHNDYSAAEQNGNDEAVDYVDIWDTNFDEVETQSDLKFSVVETKTNAKTGTKANPAQNAGEGA